MSIIQVRLHHILVWRAIQWITKGNVDWRKVEFQIPVLVQILLLMLDSKNDRGT